MVCWIWKLVIYAFKYYYNVNVSLLSAFIRIFDVNTPKNMGEYPFFFEALKIACFPDACFNSKSSYSFHLISIFNFHMCVYDINKQKMEF